MNYRRVPRFGVLLSVLFVVALQVSAQEATIVGTVTDPTGATVPNANIRITNSETGRVSVFSTSVAGEYVAPSLRIGHYLVRAEAAGFRPIEQKDVVLQVGDRVRVDFKLQVGAATEEVTVEAGQIAVQTDTGEVSSMISGQQVADIATNGRNIYLLATLLPGVSNAMSGDFQLQLPVSSDDKWAFNGNRPGHSNFLIDGGEDYDRGGEGRLSVMPSLESIAEFRALTSNYSAEYGLSSSGTVTLVLKSGTQQIHAAAWEFLRNDWLDASNFFTNAAAQPKPELRFNEFGFNVGGPVTFGKLYNKDKNKTFFFYNMEWRKYVQGGGVINQTVPLTSWYGGNMAGGPTIHVPSATQVAPSILAKFTAAGLTPGQSFPNNTIPASLLDPNAQILLKAGIFPAPTSGTQFIKGVTAPTDLRDENLRIDHHFTDKFTVFGHLIAEQINQGFTTPMWSGANVPTIGNTFGNPTYSAVGHIIQTINPSLVNEVAFNYNGNRLNIALTGLYQQPSGLSIPRLFPGPNADNRIPQINLTGSTGAQYQTQAWPWTNTANSYQWRDDLSWTRGSHQLRIGGSIMWYTKIQELFGNTNGSYSFNGTYTGNDFADFLLGFSNSYTEQAVQDFGHWNNKSYALYVQDNWRVNNRLTLNLGLRWDGVPHTYEATNRMSNFYSNLYDPSKAAILLPDGTISPSSPGLITSPNPILKGVQFYGNGMGIAGVNGISNGLVNNHWAAFGPRAGFAYDLTGKAKTILRGGFGIMYERIQGNDMYNSGANIPFSDSVSYSGVSLSSPNTSLLTGQTLVAPILPASIQGLNNTDYKLPMSMQFSLGVQQALGQKTVLTVAYVGMQSRHQSENELLNLPSPGVLPALINNTVQFNNVNPYPGYGGITLYANDANSHYNSLQVSLNSRLRSDLTFQAAYTYSKAIDSSSGNGSGGDLQNIANPYSRAYGTGPAWFNRSSVFNANFTYDIPAFRHASSRAARSLLGGWQFAGYVTAMTGLPLNITLGGAANSNGLPIGQNRPNVNGSVSYPHTINAWFNTSAFSQPAAGQWGTLGYDAVTGPGRFNTNLSIFKSFLLSEKRGSSIQLRVESFNVFNHTQWQNVSNSFTASNFGQVTSAFDPRVFQLGMKAYF
ncbi:MAG TPA: TonB-dependent receptor [Verrucomicrobiae bacterium]|nr:TonB-dependent receptor [Verrucomicrobiae bacterium]